MNYVNKIKIFIAQTFCVHDFKFKKIGGITDINGCCQNCKKKCLYDDSPATIFHSSFQEFYDFDV